MAVFVVNGYFFRTSLKRDSLSTSTKSSAKSKTALTHLRTSISIILQENSLITMLKILSPQETAKKVEKLICVLLQRGPLGAEVSFGLPGSEEPSYTLLKVCLNLAY